MIYSKIKHCGIENVDQVLQNIIFIIFTDEQTTNHLRLLAPLTLIDLFSDIDRVTALLHGLIISFNFKESHTWVLL